MVDFVEYPDLVEFLQSQFGDSLQTVSYWDSGKDRVRLLYIRSDIDEFQDEESYKEIAMELIEDLGKYMEVDSWHRMGGLNMVVRSFDYSTFLIVPVDDELSITITIDPQHHIPNPLSELAHRIAEHT